MRFKRFIVLILILMPLFFIHGCVKKSEKVPMEELKEIVTKTENNYTVTITASELGVSQKATIKVDGPLGNVSESSQWKYQIKQDNEISYFHIRNNEMIEIYNTSGEYIGKQSTLKDPTSILDFKYFKDLLANNIDSFTYDTSRKIYTGTIVEADEGKITMRLSVSGGHLIYFDISVVFDLKGISPSIGRMSFEFSDYGKTTVDLPTYRIDDETVYAEGAGQITNLTWKRIINNVPSIYNIRIRGTDPFTNEQVLRAISFDNTDGDYRTRDNDSFYKLFNNKPISLQKLSSYWFAMDYDGELTDILADLVNEYLASYLEFNYNNQIGGYERYIDDLKVEVQFFKDKLAKITLSKGEAKLEYTITYNNVRLDFPLFEYVDELPTMPFSREVWQQVCREDVYSYQAMVTGPGIDIMYNKINNLAFNDSTLNYLLMHNFDANDPTIVDTKYYILDEGKYYRIEKDDDDKYYAHETSLADIPVANWYEEYIIKISDYDHIRYDWDNSYFIYENGETTIYIYLYFEQYVNQLKIIESGKEYNLYFYRLNRIEASLPYYEQFRYYPPFSSNNEWLASINNLGNNYTLTYLNQNNEIISTTYIDIYNDANRIKIVNGDETNYYTIIDNQYYALIKRGDNWFLETTTLNLDYILKSEDIITLLDPNDYIFNPDENYYEGSFIQNGILYNIKVRFTDQRLDWIWIEQFGDVVQYTFSDWGTTLVDYPNASSEEIWWHSVINGAPKSYTIDYVDEVNPSQNATIKLVYSGYEQNRILHEVYYQPVVGELQYFERFSTSEGYKYTTYIKVGTSYYHTFCDGLEDEQFELIEPYRMLLDSNYDLFAYDEASNGYVATIDGVTYIVQITNNCLSNLTVQTLDDVKHYAIRDYGTTIIDEFDNNFMADFETKPSEEELNRILNLNLETYYFHYSDNQKSGTFYVEPILKDGELIGYAYQLVDNRPYYDYVVMTNDEQYALKNTYGRFTKVAIEELTDMNTHLVYLSLIATIMQKYKENPDLIVYSSSLNSYYLGIDNIQYTYRISSDYRYLTIESETNKIEIYCILNRDSFIVPSTNTRLKEDELFRIMKDKPLNYDVSIDYQVSGIEKQLLVSCAFESNQYGLIKIIDETTTLYYDGQKMYEVINDELVETAINNELLTIVRTLDDKDTILHYYSTHYLSVRYTPYGDYYSVTTPESLLEIGAVSVTFMIVDNEITSFTMTYGDNQIVFTFSNYGGVDLTQ
ncbi:MAG: hypothetical protein J5666_05395 [Bacilli bacterium]|nr:hypothetical protein [Bacilli bacterium]